MKGLIAAGFVLLICTACSKGTIATQSLDQAATHGAEPKVVADIQTPEGFRAVRWVAGLNYPSSMTWDAGGSLYVLESHTVPVPLLKPKILRVGSDGEPHEIDLEGPAAPSGEQAIGLEFHDGWLYFSHEEKDGTWGISRVRPDGGAVEAVLRNLPGNGDHAVNYLLFDRQGDLYFGLGSATNSGVVSSHDPVNGKWMKKRPAVHDVPCRDLTLTGASFTDENELTEEAGDRAVTSAFGAYGAGPQRSVPGQVPCTSAVYRLRKGATAPEVMAWGFRNPVALAWDPKGTLLIGMHGADIRGTRPVLDDPDAVYRLRKDAWYGWPDYSAALVPITDARYRAPAKFFPQGQDKLAPVIDERASGLGRPDKSLLVTATDPHAALGGMTVVPSGGPFGRWAGRLLISEMGDFRPTTDAANPDVRAGFQVESVDLATGKREVFVRNRGTGPSEPASHLDLEDGLERPVDVKVGPDGLVYVLDFGVFESTPKPEVLPKTGKVFRIEPVSGNRP